MCAPLITSNIHVQIKVVDRCVHKCDCVSVCGRQADL